MQIIQIVFTIVLIATSLFLTLLILMHKAKGGGMSDMFGGGLQSTFSGSGIAERNLNRITIVMSLLWVTAVVLLGFLQKF